MMSSLMATLGLDVSPFKRGLMESQANARAGGREIAESFGGFIGEKLGMIASVAGIEETIRRTIEYGEKVDILSDRLGMSTEAVQRWDYALKMNGSSMEAASGFFTRLAAARQKALQGTEVDVEAFQRLGVSISDLTHMRLEDIGARIAESLRAGDPQALIGDLRTVGGRGATELAAAFKKGLAEEMGNAPIISDEAIAKLREAADDAKSIWAGFIASVAPGVSKLYEVVRTGLFGIATSFVASGAAIKAFLQTGNSGNAVKAFGETFSEAFEGLSLEQAKAEEQREKRKAAGQSTAGLSELENTKAEHKLQEDILKMKEKAAEIAARSIYAEATAAQKIQALTEQIAIRKIDAAHGATEWERARAELDVAEMSEKLREAKNQKAKEDEREAKKEAKEDRYRTPQVSDRQRIGAYVDPRLAETQNIAQRSEGHLKEILATLREQNKLAKHTRY